MPPYLRQRLPISLDGMSPENPGLLALAEMPSATGVTCHAIIAVKGNGPVEKGYDGLVTYQSAQVSCAKSDLVARARHSGGSEPATMEEVRRILLEHPAEMDSHQR